MSTSVEQQKLEILNTLTNYHNESLSKADFEISKSIQSPAALFFENVLSEQGVDGGAVIALKDGRLLVSAPNWMSFLADKVPRLALLVPLLQSEELRFLNEESGINEEITAKMVEGIPVKVSFYKWREDEGVRLAEFKVLETAAADLLEAYIEYLKVKSVVEPSYSWPEPTSTDFE
jgi:hypothetical protein